MLVLVTTAILKFCDTKFTYIAKGSNYTEPNSIIKIVSDLDVTVCFYILLDYVFIQNITLRFLDSAQLSRKYNSTI